MTGPNPLFVLLRDKARGFSVVNLSQVRVIEKDAEGVWWLIFSPTHRQRLQGTGGQELAETIMLRAIETNGEPVKESVQREQTSEPQS